MPISKYFYVTYIYHTREEVIYFVYFFKISEILGKLAIIYLIGINTIRLIKKNK